MVRLRIKRFVPVFFAGICSMLTGCLSDFFVPKADMAKFYILDSVAQKQKYDIKDKVVLSPVILSGYLDRPQITTLDGSNMATMSEFNRWIELPDGMFTRNFAKCLGQNLGYENVYIYPEYPESSQTCNVRINVVKCIGALGGELEFMTRWTLDYGGGDIQVYSFEKKISAGDGYDGYVNAISECVSEASAAIAKSISQNSKKE